MVILETTIILLFAVINVFWFIHYTKFKVFTENPKINESDTPCKSLKCYSCTNDTEHIDYSIISSIYSAVYNTEVFL